MTRREAFELIDNVMQQLKFTRSEHIRIMEAMQILQSCQPDIDPADGKKLEAVK